MNVFGRSADNVLRDLSHADTSAPHLCMRKCGARLACLSTNTVALLRRFGNADLGDSGGGNNAILGHHNFTMAETSWRRCTQRLSGVRIGEASFTSWTERQRQERQTHLLDTFSLHDTTMSQFTPSLSPFSHTPLPSLAFPRSARSLAVYLVMERRPSAGPRSNDSRHTWRCTALGCCKTKSRPCCPRCIPAFNNLVFPFSKRPLHPDAPLERSPFHGGLTPDSQPQSRQGSLGPLPPGCCVPSHVTQRHPSLDRPRVSSKICLLTGKGWQAEKRTILQ